MIHQLETSQRLCLYKGTEIKSSKSGKKFWAQLLHSSADGIALSQAKNAPGSSQWLTEGTHFLRGREFIELVRIRINALPCLARTKRGRDAVKTCQAGCRQQETLGHILQCRPRTHHIRIRRHNNITKYVAERLRKLEFTVAEEPHYTTPQGVRIPDLVARWDGQAVILDAQVVSGRPNLSTLHTAKIMKYVDEALLSQVGERPVVSSITLSYRGVWALESVKTLKDYASGTKILRL